MSVIRVLTAGGVGCIVLAPIAAGLLQLLLTAVGHAPALGHVGTSIAPLAAFLETPGLLTALRLTLVSGIGATCVSLALAAFLALAIVSSSDGSTLIRRLLAPVLALPHAALAIGLAFVIAPSGLIARMLSPWATGWTAPPDIATVNDPWGLALMAGLVLKETAFLTLAILTAIDRLPVAQTMRHAHALGYDRLAAWVLLVLPQAYRLIRLPVFAVLSYALSVVDMALVLGPSQPPTLSVLVIRRFTHPDLDSMLPASAGAVALLAVVLCAFGFWILVEHLVAVSGRLLLYRGSRQVRGWEVLQGAAMPAVIIAAMLTLLSVVSLAVWSVSRRWNFPDALPASWSLDVWRDASAIWGTRLVLTGGLAILSTAVAVALAIGWLAATNGHGGVLRGWLYLPLIVPQAVVLPGIYAAMLRIGLHPGFGAVLWMHVVFVFPYALLMIADPWRRLDRRFDRIAASLGAGPGRRLFRVRLPMLARPLITAAAVGVGVSVAQYLTTLFAGAGRIVTLTTEAVALSSGADRRIGAVYAVLQALVPLVGYLCAGWAMAGSVGWAAMRRTTAK